jgi:predicted metal-dependent HD superfamily phosphohydrolase
MSVGTERDSSSPQNKIKSVKELSSGYVFAGEIDVQNRRVILALNLIGLVMLFVFGWLFVQLAEAVRPEPPSSGLSTFWDGLQPLWLLLGIVGVFVLHELIHGFFFWLFTGDRPQFGLHILYAYAAAPDWYLPRNRFIIAAAAPFILITMACLALLPSIAPQAVSELLIILTLNAAGSVGDLLVTGWLITQPRTTMVNDTGPAVSFYMEAEPAVAVMSHRWLDLVRSLGVDEGKARRAFADLVANYNEEGRYYHNLAHIGLVLNTANELSQLAKDYEKVQLAIWYHDVIYDPRAKDNEARSAAYAQRQLPALGFPAETVTRVSDLILATTTHLAEDGDIDAQIMLDADLAPLAYDTALFFQQSEALREEFSYIPEEEYRQSRIRVLKTFLSRERIYQTDQLYSELEAKARSNLQNSLNELSQ